MQDLLRRNGPALAAERYYLLGDGLRTDRLNKVEWPLWYLERAAKLPGLLASDLTAQIANIWALEPQALILSAENLALPQTAGAVLPLVQMFDSSIIYYLRRQDRLLLSSWRQWGMKRGISLSQHILRRVVEGKPDFGGTLKFWLEHVPAERIHVRFIDPPWLDGGSLAADLFSALGVGISDTQAAGEANASPDRAILLFLSRHPELFESVHDDRAVQLLAEADRLPPRRLTLDAHTERSLKLFYDPVNIAICRQHLGREDGADVLTPVAPENAAETGDEDRARLADLMPRVADSTLRSLLADDLQRGR